MKKQPKFCETCGEKLIWRKQDIYDTYTGEVKLRLVCKHFVEGITSVTTPHHTATYIYK